MASDSRSSLARRGAAAALLGAALLAVSPPAAAQPADEPSAADKETARSLMDLGDAMLAQNRLDKALEAYKGADSIMKLPTTGIEVGRTLEKLNRLLDARQKLLDVARLAPLPGEHAAQVRARSDAKQMADLIAQRIPSLVVKVNGVPEGTAVQVFVDEQELPGVAARLPRKVDPGPHVVRVSAPGYATATREVAVPSGTVAVELTLEPVAPQLGTVPVPQPAMPVPAPLPPDDDGGGGVSPLVWAGFGVAAAGLVVGGITGGLSLSQTADIESGCDADGNCPLSAQGDIDSANTLANVSNVGFIVAGVGAIVGGVGVGLTLASSSDDDPPAAGWRLTPFVGPGSFGLRGAF